MGWLSSVSASDSSASSQLEVLRPFSSYEGTGVEAVEPSAYEFIPLSKASKIYMHDLHLETSRSDTKSLGKEMGLGVWGKGKRETL